MHWLILVGVLLVVGFVYCGLQYLYFWLIKGDYEDQENQFNTSTVLSFNKTFDKKLRYYPLTRVAWFKIYMNAILPVMAIASIYSTVNMLIQQTATIPYILSTFLLLFFAVFNCFVFRGIDSIAFWFNICANIAFLIYLFVNLMGFGDGQLDEFGVAATIISMCFWIPIVALNIGYFCKRKDLMCKTLKQLKKEWDD